MLVKSGARWLLIFSGGHLQKSLKALIQHQSMGVDLRKLLFNVHSNVCTEVTAERFYIMAYKHTDGLVQDFSKLQSCTKPSIWSYLMMNPVHRRGWHKKSVGAFILYYN